MASTRNSIASLPLLRQLSFARKPTTSTRRWPNNISAIAISNSRNFNSTPDTKASSPPNASSKVAKPAAKNKSATPRSIPQQQTHSESRNRAITSKHHYGVIGGGLTGLTTAHYLARHAKDAHITLYEASGQLGGWVHADTIDTEHGSVSMHKGPRMIRSSKSATRYDDLVFYDVLASLDIGDQLKDVGQQASTRYLYYPDHLVRLPGPPLTPSNIIDGIKTVLTEPLFDGTIPAALQFMKWKGEFQPCTQETLDSLERDESVGGFLERILENDNRPIKNIVSAMLHGIYGGDPYKLSAKHTIFSSLWYKDVGGRLNDMTWMPCKEFALLADIFDGPNRRKVVELAEGAIYRGMLAFEDGMVTLVNALEKDLAKRPNVTIHKNCSVRSLEPNNGKVILRSASDKSAGENEMTHDKVISTIVAKQTARLVKPEHSLSALEETHAVTIQVVNLWYPEEGLLRNTPGFGYLVPSSTPNNDANVLGVIFDSELQLSNEPGTKLTVMMGGHHWDGNAFLPTDEQGIEIAIETVSKHLGIPRMEGMHASARTCKECLPQHYVGHRNLMARAHEQLSNTFKGGLMVAGPSYTNAGIMPSMRAGFEVAMRVARGRQQPWFGSERHKGDRWWSGTPVWPGSGDTSIKDRVTIDHIGETGLAGFCYNEQDTMTLVSPSSLILRQATQEKNRYTDQDGNWTKALFTTPPTRNNNE